MSASERQGGSKLKVFLAGRVALEADGTVIGEERFPGRQGRLLFAYLVAEQGRPVPRDELAEALWGEEPPATRDKALTVLVSKLRGLLADQGIDAGGALTSAFGCYRLPRDRVPAPDGGARRRRQSSGGTPGVRAVQAAARGGARRLPLA